MQTFLPYPNFYNSARALDTRRRNNQRNEGLVIARTLLDVYPRTKTGRRGGWPHHPATKMWAGYEHYLIRYIIAFCQTCRRRGTADSVEQQARELRHLLVGEPRRPPWLGDPDIHRSHQSNLIRKDPAFYGPKFPGVPDDLPYIWPV
jgi:hypothetical protein